MRSKLPTESPSQLPLERGRPQTGKPLVALVGNPNAGKTTLFNALTGSHQKVGNYPGVTVESVSGTLRLDDRDVECTDVPGLYSLQAVSEDERVALQVIEGSLPGTRRPDLLVCVVDATNLERNLYFYHQLADAGYPAVVALTMVDRLDPGAGELDLDRLSELLGTEVAAIVGHTGRGLAVLRSVIARGLDTPRPPHIETPPAPEWAETSGATALPETEEGGVVARYEWAAWVQREAIRPARSGTPDAESVPGRGRLPRKRKTRTDRLDAVLTHRVFGLLVFVATMYVVFISIYSFSQPFMNAITGVFDFAKDHIRPLLAGVPVLQSLVVDGIIGGVGAMLVFLPQILILFFFIAVLEGSGYLARAAFLMDRLLGWCGLNGRAFIPLLSSFACAIPGIMAARVMPDRNSRLATILVSPLMSCSARLPVYLLLIGAFIQPKFGAGWAGFTLFAMHFFGLMVAIPIVWFLNRKVLKGKRLPFLLELPPYQWPRWKDVWLAMYFRSKVFVTTAGTIIVTMSVIIWALCYFPHLSPAQRTAAERTYVVSHVGAKPDEVARGVDQEQLAQSVLGRFGRAIEPVFRPAGFDWRITTSILSAFPARENVVPALGIIFSLGGDTDRLERSSDLRQSLQEATWPDGRPLFTPWTAVGLMVFFALCAQCMATLATVRRETNSWGWPAFMFTYMTLLAYIGAVFVHQLSRAF